MIDYGDNVIASGFVNGRERNGLRARATDFAVFQLEGTSGEKTWSYVLDGTDMPSADAAQDVAVDSIGNVTAVGSTEQGDDVNLQLTTVAIDGPTGAEVWRRSTGEGASQGLAVAVGDDRSPVVVGRTERSGFTVQKLDGGFGDELWRRELRGSSERGSGTDSAYAVAVDGSGDVIAAGSTFNDECFFDFTVVKLSGADGTSVNQCFGDCSGDLSVGVNELVLGVRILLDEIAATACPAFDVNGDRRVTVNELVRAVRYLLTGCPA